MKSSPNENAMLGYVGLGHSNMARIFITHLKVICDRPHQAKLYCKQFASMV